MENAAGLGFLLPLLPLGVVGVAAVGESGELARPPSALAAYRSMAASRASGVASTSHTADCTRESATRACVREGKGTCQRTSDDAVLAADSEVPPVLTELDRPHRLALLGARSLVRSCSSTATAPRPLL